MTDYYKKFEDEDEPRDLSNKNNKRVIFKTHKEINSWHNNSMQSLKEIDEGLKHIEEIDKKVQNKKAMCIIDWTISIVNYITGKKYTINDFKSNKK